MRSDDEPSFRAAVASKVSGEIIGEQGGTPSGSPLSSFLLFFLIEIRRERFQGGIPIVGRMAGLGDGIGWHKHPNDDGPLVGALPRGQCIVDHSTGAELRLAGPRAPSSLMQFQATQLKKKGASGASRSEVARLSWTT